MPSLILDNTIQVRLVWSSMGTPYAVNVLNCINQNVLTDVNQSAADNVAGELKTRFLAQTAFRAYLQSGFTLSQVGLRDMNSANNPEYATAVTGAAGTSTDAWLPGQITLCATLRTAKAGRSYRGRYYQSGFAHNASSGFVAQSGVQAAMLGWLNALDAGLDAQGLTLGVGSRALGKTEAVTGIVLRDLTWDTQRRRAVPGI